MSIEKIAITQPIPEVVLRGAARPTASSPIAGAPSLSAAEGWGTDRVTNA